MSMRGIINLETYVKREAAAEGASRLDYAGGIAVNWGVNKGRHVCRGPRDRRLGHCSGLLPALKGEGLPQGGSLVRGLPPSPSSPHGWRAHMRPPRPVRPAVGRGPGLRPITPTPRRGLPPSSQGLGDMWAPVGASPCGDTICSAMLSSAQTFYALPRPWKEQGLPFVLSLAT